MNPIAAVVGLVGGVVLAAVLSRSWDARKAERLLKHWRREATEDLARAARRRSMAVVRGQVAEQIAPLSIGFGWDPGDARFLGKPVDYVIFDGLTETRLGHLEGLREIVFVDIKTGQAGLSRSERRIKACIEAGRVSFSEPVADR